MATKTKTARITVDGLTEYGAVRRELDLWKIDPTSYQ